MIEIYKEMFDDFIIVFHIYLFIWLQYYKNKITENSLQCIKIYVTPTATFVCIIFNLDISSKILQMLIRSPILICSITFYFTTTKQFY